MKYLRQFFIILAVSFLGELLRYLLPLPIPASIYGMLLLFVFLLTGIIKLDAVRETGQFFVQIMPVMFIPAGVGLLTSWSKLKPILIPISVITVVTIVTVMVATGQVSDWSIRRQKKKDRQESKYE